MPYSSNSDLPARVKDHLPEHAQEIYRKAFNSAYDEYQDPGKRRTKESLEEVSHKVAWSAVKDEYEKTDSGEWKRSSDR